MAKTEEKQKGKIVEYDITIKNLCSSIGHLRKNEEKLLTWERDLCISVDDGIKT